MNKWYSIRSEGESAEILIYEPIGKDFFGEGVGAKTFANDLKKLKAKNIDIRINSPGGSVFEGLAIFNALKRHTANITTYIDGLAASMASVIAMAGDRVVMAENALMMIHNPYGMALGDAGVMRKMADTLDKTRESLVSAYVAQTGKDESSITAMMDEETWMTAAEAVNHGFAHTIGDQVDLDATAYAWPQGLEIFKRAPEWVRERFDALRSASTGAVRIAASLKPSVATGEPEGDIMNKQASNATVQVDDTAPVEPQHINEDDVRAEALQTEAKRREGIRKVFSRFGDEHKDVLDACLDDFNVTVDTARAKLLDAMGHDSTPLGQEPVILRDERDKFRAAALNNILGRAGIEQIDAGNEYRGDSLIDLCRHSLKIANKSVAGMSRLQIVGAGFTTSDFPYLLSTSANKSLLRGYEEAPETYPVWTRRGNLSDFKVADRVGLSLFSDLDLVPEDGEFKHGTFTEAREQIQLLTYGKLFNISRQAIINDDLQAFTEIPRRMGRAARRKVGDLAYAVLTANPNMADGVALFHANHNNYVAGGSGAPPSVATVGAVRTAMGKQTDPSGNGTLNIRPSLIIVPLALEDTVRVLMASEYDPASTTNSRAPNPVRGSLQVVSDARLDTDSALKWYVASDPNVQDTVEVAFLDGNDAPMLEQQNGWTVDGVEFKVRIDAAAKAIDWRSLYLNAGA